MPPAPVSMDHDHMHGNELLVATDIEKVTASSSEYDDYLHFLDVASIASIECEDHQRFVPSYTYKW